STPTAGTTALIQFNGNSTPDWQSFLSAASTDMQIDTPSATRFYGPFNDTNWHHFIYQVNTTGNRVFIDGSEIVVGSPVNNLFTILPQFGLIEDLQFLGSNRIANLRYNDIFFSTGDPAVVSAGIWSTR
ncbi:hypothetical protein OAV62_02080, partial [bacterium]|nr:hypothetical protein [bacterium]